MAICNMDCFNCVHPDCINDSVEEDTALSDTWEMSKEEITKMKRKISHHNWYMRNRERLRKEYKEADAEERKRKRHEYYMARRDYYLAVENDRRKRKKEMATI